MTSLLDAAPAHAHHWITVHPQTEGPEPEEPDLTKGAPWTTADEAASPRETPSLLPAPAVRTTATVYDLEVLDPETTRRIDRLRPSGRVYLYAHLEPTIIRDAHGEPLFELRQAKDQISPADFVSYTLLMAIVASAATGPVAHEPSVRWLKAAEAWAAGQLPLAPTGAMAEWRGSRKAHVLQIADALRTSWRLPALEVVRITGVSPPERTLWTSAADADRLDAVAAEEARAKKAAEEAAARVAREAARPRTPREMRLHVFESVDGRPLRREGIDLSPAGEREPVTVLPRGWRVMTLESGRKVACLPYVEGLTPSAAPSGLVSVDDDAPLFGPKDRAENGYSRFPEANAESYRALASLCPDRGPITSWDVRGEEIAREALEDVAPWIRRADPHAHWRVLHAFDVAVANAPPDWVAALADDLCFDQVGRGRLERAAGAMSRREIETLALQKTAAGFVRPTEFAPAEDGPDPWASRLAAACAGRVEISSDELVAALRAEGVEVAGHAKDHARIHHLMCEAGWSKRQVQKDGGRRRVFVRASP